MRNSGRYENDLTDGEWLAIEPPLPPPWRLGRHRATDFREVFNAVRYILTKGYRWRAIPSAFRRSRRFGITSSPGATVASPDALQTYRKHTGPRAGESLSRANDGCEIQPSEYDVSRKVKGRKWGIAVDVGEARIRGSSARCGRAEPGRYAGRHSRYGRRRHRS